MGDEPARPAEIDRVDGRRADLGMAGEPRLDLTRLDPQPVQLDLPVGPAEELQDGARAVPAAVSGAIEALATARMREEGGRGGRLVAEIARRESVSGDVQVALDIVRAGPQSGVGYVIALVRQRISVGDRRQARGLVGRVEPVRPDRRLGRAAERDHGAAGRQTADRVRPRQRPPVAGKEHVPHALRQRAA